jgi:hypothetical protein
VSLNDKGFGLHHTENVVYFYREKEVNYHIFFSYSPLIAIWKYIEYALNLRKGTYEMFTIST